MSLKLSMLPVFTSKSRGGTTEGRKISRTFHNQGWECFLEGSLRAALGPHKTSGLCDNVPVNFIGVNPSPDRFTTCKGQFFRLAISPEIADGDWGRRKCVGERGATEEGGEGLEPHLPCSP